MGVRRRDCGVWRRHLLPVAVTVVALVSPFMATGHAQAALEVGAPRDTPERAGQIAAYRTAYPHLTIPEATRRAAEQPLRAALLSRVSRDHAVTFGGSWYDPGAGVQHLNATTDAARDAFESIGAATGIAVEVHTVTYSLDALYERADRIRDGRLPVVPAAERLGVGVDAVRNRVVVTVEPSAARLSTSMLLSDPAVVIQAHKPAATVPEACHSRFNCSAPLRSGVALRRDGVNLCSVGFTARGSDGTGFAVTAGHCMSVANEMWAHNEVAIGPMNDAWNAENIDVSRIRMNRSPWMQASGGWMYNEGNPNSPTALDAAITQFGQIQQGDTACLQGFNTNVRHACGLIETASDPDYRGLVRVAFDGCGGDSGGGWYAPNGGNRTALGIHHGGAKTCHSQYGWSYFSPLPAINAFWDRHSATTIRVETR